MHAQGIPGCVQEGGAGTRAISLYSAGCVERSRVHGCPRQRLRSHSATMLPFPPRALPGFAQHFACDARLLPKFKVNRCACCSRAPGRNSANGEDSTKVQIVA